MSDKTILVTGGAGFIGSNFVRHLYNKYPGVPDPRGGRADLRRQRRQPARGRAAVGALRVLVRRRPERRADGHPGLAGRRRRAHGRRVPRDALHLRQPPVLRDGRAGHADRRQRRHQVSRPRRALHPRLDVGGLRLGALRADGRGASAQPAEPVRLGQVRRRPARLLLLGDLPDPRGDRATVQQLRALPAPGEGGPALHHVCILDEPMPVHGDGSAARDFISRRGPLRGARPAAPRPARAGRRARCSTSAPAATSPCSRSPRPSRRA